MSETIELEGGYVAEISHDPDCEQPFNGHDGVKLVVLHGKYMDPSEGACGRTPDEIAEWENNNPEWFTTPLWLYDHSGVSYAAGETNPFHCPWDSGQVGIVAMKRSEWGNGNESDAKLAEYANNIAREYGQWANGECFAYAIKDSEGNIIASCGGYIGIDGAIEAAKDAAPEPLAAPGM